VSAVTKSGTLPVTVSSKTFAATTEINNEHRLAHLCAAEAVNHAIRCGELLVAKKAELGHGNFMPWVKANCEFSYASAAVYIKAHNQSSSGLEFSSLRELFPSGRRVAPSPRLVVERPDQASGDSDDIDLDADHDVVCVDHDQGVDEPVAKEPEPAPMTIEKALSMMVPYPPYSTMKFAVSKARGRITKLRNQLAEAEAALAAAEAVAIAAAEAMDQS
jgi:hypothetical protein